MATLSTTGLPFETRPVPRRRPGIGGVRAVMGLVITLLGPLAALRRRARPKGHLLLTPLVAVLAIDPIPQSFSLNVFAAGAVSYIAEWVPLGYCSRS